MKIRADLHVNGGSRKLVLVPDDNEKPEHLALKLAAYILFWDADLVVGAGVGHPALRGQEMRPDLLGTDISGAVSLWVECGNTSLNKVGKAIKRFPYAQVVVLKETPALARRFRAEFGAGASGRVEVLTWPEGAFADWASRLDEKTEVVGSASRTELNLVVNDRVFVTDLARIP